MHNSTLIATQLARAGLDCLTPSAPYALSMFVFCFPQAVFLFSLIKYAPLKYNNSYVYPPWGYVLGWLMALSSMVCIPLYIIFILLRTKGSLKQVLRLWSLGELLLLPHDSSWEGPWGRYTSHIFPLRRQGEVWVPFPQNALQLLLITCRAWRVSAQLSIWSSALQGFPWDMVPPFMVQCIDRYGQKTSNVGSTEWQRTSQCVLSEATCCLVWLVDDVSKDGVTPSFPSLPLLTCASANQVQNQDLFYLFFSCPLPLLPLFWLCYFLWRNCIWLLKRRCSQTYKGLPWPSLYSSNCRPLGLIMGPLSMKLWQSWLMPISGSEEFQVKFPDGESGDESSVKEWEGHKPCRRGGEGGIQSY